MNKFFGHLSTVTKHRYLVFKHCVKAGIPWQGLTHDLSKFSFCEFFNGVKYFTDGKKSPTVKEREERGYSVAWLHHKGRNKHHHEYWTELNFRGEPLKKYKMPLKYVKEMFCDRVAATKVYKKEQYTDSSALEYYETKKDENFMHPETAALLKNWLVSLSENGEKATFKRIRITKSY